MLSSGPRSSLFSFLDRVFFCFCFFFVISSVGEVRWGESWQQKPKPNVWRLTIVFLFWRGRTNVKQRRSCGSSKLITPSFLSASKGARREKREGSARWALFFVSNKKRGVTRLPACTTSKRGMGEDKRMGETQTKNTAVCLSLSLSESGEKNGILLVRWAHVHLQIRQKKLPCCFQKPLHVRLGLVITKDSRKWKKVEEINRKRTNNLVYPSTQSL